MKHQYAIIATLLCASQTIHATDLTKSTIVYSQNDHPLVQQMANVLSEDIERVTGIKPEVSTKKGKGQNIILSTQAKTSRHKELRGTWERFAIDTDQENLYITGSDARGLAYGVFHVSEQIGVNPWQKQVAPCAPSNSSLRSKS